MIVQRGWTTTSHRYYSPTITIEGCRKQAIAKKEPKLRKHHESSSSTVQILEDVAWISGWLPGLRCAGKRHKWCFYVRIHIQMVVQKSSKLQYHEIWQLQTRIFAIGANLRESNSKPATQKRTAANILHELTKRFRRVDRTEAPRSRTSLFN